MIPLTCGMGLCSSNCPAHKGWVYLFPHKRKIETKRIIKITNPPKKFRKSKERKKRKPTIKKKR
jgi:hypothetical protein